MVELIIPPQSSLLGQRLLESRLQRDPEIHIIAIKRSGLHFTEKQIHDVRLRVGDIVLIWCHGDKLERMRDSADFIIAEDVHHEIVQKSKAWKAGLIFAGLVVAASTGLADIMVCALTAVFFMIVTGCLQMRDAYRAVQADVLLLIAGTLALGAAMEKTGASRMYAEAFLRLFAGASPALVLGGFILLVSISTQILSNNATAVLLLPIAVSTALGLERRSETVYHRRMLRSQRLLCNPDRLSDQSSGLRAGGLSFQRLPETGHSPESCGSGSRNTAHTCNLAVLK